MSTQVAEPALAARVDSRSRGRRLLAPALAAVLSVGALGYLYLVNPNEPGHYPPCPTQVLLGVDCPGCGLLRAGHALMHGDIPRALDHNILVLMIGVVAVGAWVSWVLRAWHGRTAVANERRARVLSVLSVASLVVIVGFGVVRNFVPYLGSGAGA